MWSWRWWRPLRRCLQRKSCGNGVQLPLPYKLSKRVLLSGREWIWKFILSNWPYRWPWMSRESCWCFKGLSIARINKIPIIIMLNIIGCQNQILGGFFLHLIMQKKRISKKFQKKKENIACLKLILYSKIINILINLLGMSRSLHNGGISMRCSLPK